MMVGNQLQHLNKPSHFGNQPWCQPEAMHSMDLNASSSSSNPVYFKQQSSSTATMAVANTPDNNDQYKYNGTLLREVSFSAGMEVESCVNAGAYANVHYAQQQQQQLAGMPFIHSNPTGDNHPMRDNPIDLYSSFREDSYSENSDDFSNESTGDNRFSSGTISTSIVNGSNSTPSVNNNGTPASFQQPDLHHHHSSYLNIGYYNHHVNNGTNMGLQQPVSAYQSMAMGYHAYGNGHVVSNVNSSAQGYDHGGSLDQHSIQRRENNGVDSSLRQYSQSLMYNNGYTSLSNTMSANLNNHHHAHLQGDLNGSTNKSPSCAYESTSSESRSSGNNNSEVLKTGESNDRSQNCGLNSINPIHHHHHNERVPPPSSEMGAGNVQSSAQQGEMINGGPMPAYTDLNNVTSLTKLQPFSGMLQGSEEGSESRVSSVKDGFQGLEEINNRDQEEQSAGSSSSSSSKEGESEKSEDEQLTEDFGEIIKKSMVETVSAC